MNMVFKVVLKHHLFLKHSVPRYLRCQSCSGYHRFPPLDDTSIDGPTTAPSLCLVRSLLDGGGTHFAQPGVTVVEGRETATPAAP